MSPPPEGLDNVAGLGPRGPAVREEVSHLPRIPSLAKKGVGHRQPQAAPGIVEVTMDGQKGGEIAAVDIGTDGQRRPVGEGEGSEPYRRLR